MNMCFPCPFDAEVESAQHRVRAHRIDSEKENLRSIKRTFAMTTVAEGSLLRVSGAHIPFPVALRLQLSHRQEAQNPTKPPQQQPPLWVPKYATLLPSKFSAHVPPVHTPDRCLLAPPAYGKPTSAAQSRPACSRQPLHSPHSALLPMEAPTSPSPLTHAPFCIVWLSECAHLNSLELQVT